MKKFENPIMEVAYFEAENVVTASNQTTPTGSNVDDANAIAATRLSNLSGATKISVAF